MSDTKIGFFKNFGTQIKEIVALNAHVDTEKAAAFIRSNIDFKGPNVYILAFAIVIASVGLNINSIPVIIGAMLVSPLMGPIFGVGYGLGTNDSDFLKQSLKNLLIMVSISVIASTLFFLISPLQLENPTELLARTNPTIYDVLIALFGGFAGIVEISRRDKGTVISGVAIATALMPPLCTAGYGLASGQFGYFLGAIYLFSINSIFIALATFVTVKYLHFPKHTFTDPKREKRVSRWIGILLIIIIAPSVYTAILMIQENSFAQKAKSFVNHNKTMARCYIYDYKIDETSKPRTLEIFIAGEALSPGESEMLYRSAETFGLESSQLKIKQNMAYTQEEITSDTAIKSILERSDKEMKSKEAQIQKLSDSIARYIERELPYRQITKEIYAQYPDIENISISRGYGIVPSTMESEEVITLHIQSKKTLSAEETSKLRDWLAVRLDFRNIRITQD